MNPHCPLLPGLLFGLTAAGLVSELRAEPGEARLYWTDKDDGQLESCDLDGGNRTILLSGLVDPRGIVIDPGAEKIYWSSHEPFPAGGIFRANCDGSDVQVFLDSLPEVADLALDLVNGMLYWAEEDANRIRRTSLGSPSNVEVVISGLNRPYYLAVDPVGGHLYWSDFDSTIIHRCTIDGADPVDFITGQSRVRDIEIAEGMIYWCDRNSSQIRRRDLAGTGGGTVLFSGAADSLDRPHGLVLDPATGTMYWTDTDAREVNRAAMDGSGSVTTLVSASLTGAWGIALSKPSTTPYSQWLAGYFPPAELADPAQEALRWGESADPDRDGILNLLEFAQGTSPLDAEQDPAAMQVSLVTEGSARYLQLVFRIRKDDPSLLVGIESSETLGVAGWQEGGVTEIPPRSEDVFGYEFVTVRAGPLGAAVPAFFARLRVSR